MRPCFSERRSQISVAIRTIPTTSTTTIAAATITTIQTCGHVVGYDNCQSKLVRETIQVLCKLAQNSCALCVPIVKTMAKVESHAVQYYQSYVGVVSEERGKGLDDSKLLGVVVHPKAVDFA